MEKRKILYADSIEVPYSAFPHITWLWTKDENKPESLSYQRPPISRRILPVYRAHHTYIVSTILIFFTLLIALATYHIGPLCLADVLFIQCLTRLPSIRLTGCRRFWTRRTWSHCRGRKRRWWRSHTQARHKHFPEIKTMSQPHLRKKWQPDLKKMHLCCAWPIQFA